MTKSQSEESKETEDDKRKRKRRQLFSYKFNMIRNLETAELTSW